MSERPLLVDLVELVVSSQSAHLVFMDRWSTRHQRSYRSADFRAALPKLIDTSAEVRLTGFQTLDMYPGEGQRQLLLWLDDGTVGDMGAPNSHGPVHDLALLLHPDSGRDRKVLAMLGQQKSTTLVNPFRSL